MNQRMSTSKIGVSFVKDSDHGQPESWYLMQNQSAASASKTCLPEIRNSQNGAVIIHRKEGAKVTDVIKRRQGTQRAISGWYGGQIQLLVQGSQMART